MSLTKICKFCSKEFEITDDDLKFYEKIAVPQPNFCPDDRQRRRASFRNERNLYLRKCSSSQRDIISMYSPDKPFSVYEQEIWWGDSWDAKNFGMDFDFNRPFFEQFKELQNSVPRLSLYNYNSQNSHYTNYSGDNKNCYMGFDLGGCEEVYHSNWITHSKNCVDCSYTYSSELNYQTLYCEKCYNCDFCQECENCMDCSYTFDCKNCNNCFACAGLRNKKFYILNKKVTEEDYKKFVEGFHGSYEKQKEALKKFKELRLSVPHKFAVIIDSEDCTGDYIYHCKNAKKCFDAVRLWDCKYCYNTLDTKNGYDCYQPGFSNSELIYEVLGGNMFFNSKFLFLCKNLSNCEYCDLCYYSHNLFGCIGIKRGKFCILNKQYKEEQYYSLKNRIIEHMKQTGEYGEFFSFFCSPFGYNESKAQEYYPLTKEGALNRKINWSDFETAIPTGETIVPPDNIKEVNDSILEKIIICEKSGRPFKIIKQELDFYKFKRLPIPRKSPQVRYEERMKLRRPRKLFDRMCSKCNTQIKTTYSPERPEFIFCEKCYLQSVY